MARPRVQAFTDLAELRAGAVALCLRRFAELAGEPWSANWHEWFNACDEAIRLERESIRFLRGKRRRTSTWERLRRDAQRLLEKGRLKKGKNHEDEKEVERTYDILFATRLILRSSNKDEAPHILPTEISASTRAHLLERVRRGPPNLWQGELRRRFRLATPRQIAVISILCGNRPHVTLDNLACGLKITDYIRMEESNIRATMRGLESKPARRVARVGLTES